jgi:hypothetical protein
MTRRLTLLFVFLAACGEPNAPTDGGRDAAPTPCHADTDCDDGVVCDGTERCVATVCVAGTPLRCDDMIACTVDTCSETHGGCVFVVPDMDHDGHGTNTCLDAHGTPLGDDCVDTDANDFPGNHEVCDAMHHDEDCNPATHGGVDADLDTYEDDRCCNGTNCGNDCDDAHASAHPGATEVCNLIDDDCDAQIDEMVSIAGYLDHDHDGFGDHSMPMSACASHAGFTVDDTDCDDANAARNPGQPEFCDNLDNDCDTIVDENASAITWYTDGDGDGFGAASSGTMMSCTPPGGTFVLRGTDCDDAHAAINPAAAELCNAIDDDCNGLADFVIAPGDLEDDDADRFPDAHCGAPIGDDCDDRDPLSGPGSPEICDGRDNDCDGTIDEGVNATVFHRDADGDGWGDPNMVRVGCSAGAGWVANGGDCDDTNAQKHPGASEVCNAGDDDCDGAIDEGEASMGCAQTHAMGACVNGACTITGCDFGFASCIGDGSQCESDVLTDPQHCGACAACSVGYSTCSSGSCGPSLGPLAAIETDAGIANVLRMLPIPGTTSMIIAGRFTGTLSIGPTPLVSAGGEDGFAAAIRADGSVIWAAQWGGPSDDRVYALAMPTDQSAFVVGGEICNGRLCGGPLTNCYSFWQRFASPLSPGCAYGSGITTSPAGHVPLMALAMEHVGANYFVYGAGSWSGTASDASLGLSAGGNDGFVFGAQEVPGHNPTLLWAFPISGTGDEVVYDLAIDGADNLVAVGSTTSGITQYGASTTRNSAGGEDAFVLNLSRSTGALTSVYEFGTPQPDRAQRILALADGDFLLAGYMAYGPMTIGTQMVMGNGSQNSFIAALTSPSTFDARWLISTSGIVTVTGLGESGTSALVTGQHTGAMGVGSGFVQSSNVSAFLVALDEQTGALRYERSTLGGTGDRSGGVAPRPDGTLLWEIDHWGPVSLPNSTLPTGSDPDLATVVVTP